MILRIIYDENEYWLQEDIETLTNIKNIYIQKQWNKWKENKKMYK